MLMFVLIAVAIVVLVSAATARIWLFREGTQNSSDDPEWQVLLAKRDEIENDALLPPDTRETLRREWAEMAAAVLPQRQVHAASSKPSGRAALVLSVTSALFGTALYMATGRWDVTALQVGSANSANSAAAQPASGRAATPGPTGEQAKHPGDSETLEERIAKLEKRLAENPADLDGWVLLSRSRGIQRDFVAATDALEKALALAPGHPDLLADLADTSAMVADRTLAGRPLELAMQALAADPQHRKALSLVATAAMQANDLPKATAYWQKLRATFEAGSPDIARVDQILANLGGAATQGAADRGTDRGADTSADKGADKGADKPASKNSGEITGEVALGPELLAGLAKKPLPPAATVFVVAKMVNGPPMPVAVARFPAEQLTSGRAVAFKLDDSQAMSPALKLSGADVVNIEARISLAGTAGRQSGDLFIGSNNVKVGTHDLRLLIQSVVP
jgi:cytochrome c-type biogenesis protein CcmH